MTKTARIVLLLFVSLLSCRELSAQSYKNCDCGALVDVDFKGKILLYNKPNGTLLSAFQHNFQKEDFLVLTIDKDSSDFFHVTIYNALTPKKGKRGWIQKNKSIGTYARNYAPNDTLFLYSKPDIKSTIQSMVPDWTNSLYSINKCFKKWAYVRVVYDGQIKEGWLQPEKQCDNPYTTCN